MYCNYTFSKKNPINLDWGDPALNATVVRTNNNKKQLTEYFHAIYSQQFTKYKLYYAVLFWKIFFARFFCNKVNKELDGYNDTDTYTQSH